MKKNILVLCPIYYPHFGGAEKAIFELYKGLSDEYNIDLLTPNFGGKKKEFNGYFTIHRVCKPSNNRVFKFFKYQYYQFKIARKLIAKKKYHLIHTHYIFPSGIVSLLLKYLYEIPLITTEHHFGTGMDIISEKENPGIINYFMKFYVNHADLIISTGNTQDNFLRFLKKDLKFKTIELGGDCVISSKEVSTIKKQLQIPKDKKIFFSISRLVKRKRYDIMLHALKELKKKRDNFICYIGGKGEDLVKLKELARELDIQDNVSFLGFMKDEDVEMYRKISNCFLSTSEFEGAGIIYFEAFASKLALFAKLNPSTQSIINHKDNGFLFENDKELASLLEKNAWDREKLQKIANSGFNDYKRKYNWNNHVKRYKKIYLKLTK